MFDGFKLLDRATLNTNEWRAIERYGMHRFLREAVATRDFRQAVDRMALDVALGAGG